MVAARRNASVDRDTERGELPERTLVLAEELRVQPGYMADRCDFWDTLCGDDDCF